MMRNGSWLMTAALAGALVLSGCAPKEDATTEETSKPDKTSVASNDVKPDQTHAKTIEGAQGAKEGPAPTAKEQAAIDAAAKKEASAAATSKEEMAKAAEAKVQAAKANVQLEAQKLSTQSLPSKTAKPAVYKNPPPPKSANRAAVATNYAGTWKRVIDAKLRSKYELVAQMQKKRGKKVFPLDNTLVLKPDGTFTWDDNAVITGRKLTGTWAVKGGLATMTIKTIDGKAPSSSAQTKIEASLDKNGKVLYRSNSEAGQYRRV